MKILVTGGNGYLGTGVSRQLCDDGVEVIAACHSKINIDDVRVNVKKCDIFNIENPFDYFEQPDVLLHMAWKNGFVLCQNIIVLLIKCSREAVNILQ